MFHGCFLLPPEIASIFFLFFCVEDRALGSQFAPWLIRYHFKPIDGAARFEKENFFFSPHLVFPLGTKRSVIVGVVRIVICSVRTRTYGRYAPAPAEPLTLFTRVTLKWVNNYINDRCLHFTCTRIILWESVFSLPPPPSPIVELAPRVWSIVKSLACRPTLFFYDSRAMKIGSLLFRRLGEISSILLNFKNFPFFKLFGLIFFSIGAVATL